MPVLISGQRGTGKIIAAKTIHQQGPASDKLFIEIDCAYWKRKRLPQSMEELCIIAKGGTLFFRNIDTLNTQDSALLKDYWIGSNRFQHTLPFNSHLSNSVRLIAGIRQRPSSINTVSNINEDYTEWLKYHSLTLELKTLSQRQQDIQALVTAYQTINPLLSQLTFTICAWKCLEQYDWPENVKQLERCLEKLSILVSGGIITADVLISNFPVMANKAPNAKVVHLRRNLLDDHNNEDRNNTKSINKASGQGFNSNRNNSAETPIPVNKALQFIQHNYANKISMADVANSACISEPHLSYLLKKHQGKSFKQLLIKRRIDEAVRLLSSAPQRQVTLICSDVGFSDLSHFEKTFKKIIGISPGRYRKQRLDLTETEKINPHVPDNSCYY